MRPWGFGLHFQMFVWLFWMSSLRRYRRVNLRLRLVVLKVTLAKHCSGIFVIFLWVSRAIVHSDLWCKIAKLPFETKLEVKKITLLRYLCCCCKYHQNPMEVSFHYCTWGSLALQEMKNPHFVTIKKYTLIQDTCGQA